MLFIFIFVFLILSIFFIYFFNGNDYNFIKKGVVVITGFTLSLSTLVVFKQFFKLDVFTFLFSGFGFFKLDGISLLFFYLSCLLVFLCVIFM
jgi:hypothetical protein